MAELRNSNYEEAEVNDILRRAMAIDATQGKHGRDLLEVTAQELGISPEALALAEEEHQREYVRQQEMNEFIQHRRKGFWEHLTTYVLVNIFLVFLNLWNFDKDDHYWFVYPLLGWGIFGVLTHALSVFTRGTDFDKEFAKWREERKSLPTR